MSLKGILKRLLPSLFLLVLLIIYCSFAFGEYHYLLLFCIQIFCTPLPLAILVMRLLYTSVTSVITSPMFGTSYVPGSDEKPSIMICTAVFENSLKLQTVEHFLLHVGPPLLEPPCFTRYSWWQTEQTEHIQALLFGSTSMGELVT